MTLLPQRHEYLSSSDAWVVYPYVQIEVCMMVLCKCVVAGYLWLRSSRFTWLTRAADWHICMTHCMTLLPQRHEYLSSSDAWVVYPYVQIEVCMMVLCKCAVAGYLWLRSSRFTWLTRAADWHIAWHCFQSYLCICLTLLVYMCLFIRPIMVFTLLDDALTLTRTNTSCYDAAY